MKTLFLALLALLIPGVAVAAPNSAVCQVLASHQPRADVIHQASGDVNANPNNFQVPEVVKVPLTVDLAKRVASLTGKDVLLESQMGMVEIHQNGKVFYNGQDWTSSVMTLCGQSHAVVPEATVALDEPKPIINRTKILNNEPVINRRSAGTRKEVVEVKPEPEPSIEAAIEPAATQEEVMPAKTAERTVIEVRPTQAIPPIDVDMQPKRTPKTSSVKTREPEVIEGGDYREIFYNE